MFDNFYKECREYNDAHQVEMVKLSAPVDSPTFNKSALLQTLDDIPSMSFDELRNFVARNFNRILDNVFSGNDINEHVMCFTNVNFLDAFIVVLQQNTRFEFEANIIIKCNNISYDYISFKDTKDPAVVSRMIAIGNIINRRTVPRLLGLGLNPDLASILAIARYSSFNLELCVKRIDDILLRQPKALMSQEMITEIFRILYAGRDIWVHVFQYFMMDVIPEYDESNPAVAWVTEDVEEINSIMNLAMLDIINTEPTGVINDVIIEYGGSYYMTNNGKPVRFSLHTISDDYSRIRDAVIYLTRNEDIAVP